MSGIRWDALLAAAARIAVLVWITGTVAWFIWSVWRYARFARIVRRIGQHDPRVQERADRLARRLGLARVPRVVFLPCAVSPMLWGVAGRLQLLFPAPLWRKLDDDARDALLLHELAHYRRGDHWVRLLELVVSGLYWWHPVVWWARRAIEAAEEECCDAWVVAHAPDSPRSYAEALLATLDFVCERRPIVPPASSGIGELPLLKRRLTSIMRRSGSHSLSRRARAVLIVVTAVALPWHPVLTMLPGPVVLASPTSGPLPSDLSFAETLSSTGGPSGDSTAGASSGTDDALPPTPRRWWEPPESKVASVTSPDGSTQLTAQVGRQVLLQQIGGGAAINLSREELTSIAFVPGGRRFVAGSLDGRVRLFDVETGRSVSLLFPHEAPVTSVAVSPNGRFAASGTETGTVLLSDIASGATLGTWAEADRPITAVRFSPNGRLLAVAAGDWRIKDSGRITLLEVEAESLAPRTVLPAWSAFSAIEFTVGGDRLLAADGIGQVTAWALATSE
ncbi:MAG: M56 family metallopeptidase, partial [Planctomycetaceae bacterium]